MKRLRSELRSRLAFVSILLGGFLWFVKVGSFSFLIGILGIALTVWYVVKTRRPVQLGTALGWGYWLLFGWKGAGVRTYFHHAARFWHGDGSFLCAVVALFSGLVFAGLLWKLSGVSMDSIPLFARYMKTGKTSQKSDVEWQPIYFVLGEEKTEENFRLGGE